jgi:hypothetical protein
LHRHLPWSRRDRVVADGAGASSLVREFEQARLDSTQLAIWTCLDNLVHSDGDRSLARLAESWTDSSSNATLPTAIAAQCRVVRSVCPSSISRARLCRNRHAVVRHPGDIDRILESSPGRRLVVLAIFDLGQLRDSAQLFNMAAERLTIFSTTTGIRY